MNEFDTLCKSCFKEIGQQKVCPFCRYNQNETQRSPYLPKGEFLEQRYLIGKKVDENTEGFGYIAYDVVSKTPVYIREFFPNGLCYRLNNSSKIFINKGCSNKFKDNFDSFLTYLRAVARLRSLSALVAIYNIFTENSTAYAVYEYVYGISLVNFLKLKGGKMSWEIARPLFIPLLSALSEMNSVGIQHLGVAPSNIVVTKENKLKLLDFSIPEIRQINSTIPPTLFDGYSAIEQYMHDYTTSEATDVYSFAATLFYTLTGVSPQKSTKRKTDNRILIPNNMAKEIPNDIILALANSLQVLPFNRIQNFEELRKSLTLSVIVGTEDRHYSDNLNKAIEIKQPQKNINKFLVIIVIILCTISLVFLGFYFLSGGNINIFDEHKVDISSNSVHALTSSLNSSSSSDLNAENKIYAPNLVGKNFQNVKASNDNENYNILLASEEFNDNVSEGLIISQTPNYKDLIEYKSPILVTVSKGSKMRSLPKIAGLSISEVSQILTEESFVPVQKQNYNDNVKEGIVIGYENRNASDKVEYGTEIIVLVSLGPNN